MRGNFGLLFTFTHTNTQFELDINQIFAQNILRVDRMNMAKCPKMRVQVLMLVLMLFLLLGVWYLYLISWNLFSNYSNKCNKPQIIKAYPSEIPELSEPPTVAEIFSLDLITVSEGYCELTLHLCYSHLSMGKFYPN